MKKFLIFPAVAALCSLAASPLQADESSGSQTFTGGRFALVPAETNVISGSLSRNNKQKIVLKIDRKTGEVWILQLKVPGAGDPSVSGAHWIKISEAGVIDKTRVIN